MLSREDNDLVTQTNQGTPMGNLIRRYWVPALLLSEEIPAADCPPVRVKLMGEELVAFRDSQGRIGLDRRALRPPRHVAFFRPQRRVRPALHLPWLEIRRRGQRS